LTERSQTILFDFVILPASQPDANDEAILVTKGNSKFAIPFPDSVCSHEERCSFAAVLPMAR
jgi:hypothetical protein